MAELPGFEYLTCICENGTQADNLINRYRRQGWLLGTISGGEHPKLIFRRRIFHSPGWYAVVDNGVGQQEFGPYLTRDAAQNSVVAGGAAVEIKYYDIDRPWEESDRFGRLADR